VGKDALGDHASEVPDVDLRGDADLEVHFVPDDNYPPFDSNAEFLDAWMIALRWQRLRVEAEQPEPQGFLRARRGQAESIPIEDVYVREKAAWDDLQTRLEAHRAADDAPVLGLELLREEHDLNGDEVTVLAALVVCAISENLANQTFGLMASTFGLSVNSLMSLLGPDQSPWQLDDWLRWRALFQKGSKLIEAGLIKVSFDPDDNPGELLDAYVHITNRGFKAITGVTP